MISGFFIFKS